MWFALAGPRGRVVMSTSVFQICLVADTCSSVFSISIFISLRWVKFFTVFFIAKVDVVCAMVVRRSGKSTFETYGSRVLWTNYQVKHLVERFEILSLDS